MAATIDVKSAKFCSGRHRVCKSSRHWVPRVPPPTPKMSHRSQKIRSRAPRRRRESRFRHFASILSPFWDHFAQTLEEIGLLAARFLSPEPWHLFVHCPRLRPSAWTSTSVVPPPPPKDAKRSKTPRHSKNIRQQPSTLAASQDATISRCSGPGPWALGLGPGPWAQPAAKQPSWCQDAKISKHQKIK